MSVAQLQSKLMELPRKDRIRFAQWFYQHEGEILDPQDDDPISPEAKAEILRRYDELKANPSLALPITKEWFDDLRKKLSIARSPKTPAA